jgi:hypothetical protein
MARRITAMTTLTPTSTADTTNLVDATYPFLLRGGSATQRNDVYEITLSGQAAATAPTIMLVALSSQVGTGGNTLGAGQTDAPTDSATAALPAAALTGNSNATNKPQRSATLHLHNMSLNAYGGIARVGSASSDRSIITIAGASANLGEITVSAFTGGTPGLIGGHMIYESA